MANVKDFKFMELENEAGNAWNWNEVFYPMEVSPNTLSIDPKVSILDKSVIDPINMDFSVGTEKIVISEDQMPSGVGKKPEELPQARIEIRTRDVEFFPHVFKFFNDRIGGESKGAPQHLFVIHIDSNGKETLIRGGPSKSMLWDDIEIVKAPYEIIDGKPCMDYVQNAPSVVIAKGTDDQMQVLFDKMWSRAQEINQEGYDYKLPLFGHVQNCNTVVKDLVDHVGLELRLPSHHDGSNILVPGIEYNLKHTDVDQTLNRAGEFVEWYVQEYKSTPKAAQKVFIAYLKSRGIEFRNQKHDPKS